MLGTIWHPPVLSGAETIRHPMTWILTMKSRNTASGAGAVIETLEPSLLVVGQLLESLSPMGVPSMPGVSRLESMMIIIPIITVLEERPLSTVPDSLQESALLMAVIFTTMEALCIL